MKRAARWRLWLLAALALFTTGIQFARGDSDWSADWPRHLVLAARPEQGFAFQADLPSGAPSAHAAPVEAVLCEDGREIGKASDHEAIRRHGAGRCSFWHGTLWFSSSDGSDPRTNGRRYEVAWRDPWPARGKMLCWTGAGGCSLWALLAWLRGRLRKRTWQRLALASGTGLVCLLAVEVVLRLRYPFGESTWPGTFDLQVGLRFAADREIQRTNLFDFAQVQRTNALGFLDREPRALADGQRRIVVLGDSFVEAVQVPIDQKFHVRLEDELHTRGIATATQAFGMSGAGTSTELGFYRVLGRPLHPALVIVLFVYNDFANNSALLESIRNGWHHEHAPRPYFRLADGAMQWQPIDPDWENYVLYRPRQAQPPLLSAVLGWSRLFQWTTTSIDWIRGTDVERANLDQHDRLLHLRADLTRRPLFDGWQHPDDLDMDGMVAAVDPPPVFRDAVRLTEHTLAVLRDEVAHDGGRLLLVLADNLIGPPVPNPRQRELLPRAWLDLAAPICQRLGVPCVDLHAAFVERGVVGRVEFVRDRHWNVLGHATAAAAVADYLAAHPALLAGPR
ncbi:MAG: SGNH/GDSL hydrolase family protein [Planctomycetes bacterium]|nr:SGNH/GDSL hydrolase family protein [Planctomycetota bacterium]